MHTLDRQVGFGSTKSLPFIAAGFVAGAWFVLWLASFGHVGESACGNLFHHNTIVQGCAHARVWTTGYGIAFLLVAILCAALAIGIRTQSSWKRWPLLGMFLVDAIALLGVVWLQSHSVDQATGLDLRGSTPSSLSIVAMSRIAIAVMLVSTVVAAAALARFRGAATYGSESARVPPQRRHHQPDADNH